MGLARGLCPVIAHSRSGSLWGFPGPVGSRPRACCPGAELGMCVCLCMCVHVCVVFACVCTCVSVCVCVCMCVSLCARVCSHMRRGQSASALARRFFEDLERRHKAQVCVEDISDILEEHAERHFHPYVAYCSNEVYQQRALQRLT